LGTSDHFVGRAFTGGLIRRARGRDQGSAIGQLRGNAERGSQIRRPLPQDPVQRALRGTDCQVLVVEAPLGEKVSKTLPMGVHVAERCSCVPVLLPHCRIPSWPSRKSS
jgi:hypothetical protein